MQKRSTKVDEGFHQRNHIGAETANGTKPASVQYKKLFASTSTCLLRKMHNGLVVIGSSENCSNPIANAERTQPSKRGMVLRRTACGCTPTFGTSHCPKNLWLNTPSGPGDSGIQTIGLLAGVKYVLLLDLTILCAYIVNWLS